MNHQSRIFLVVLFVTALFDVHAALGLEAKSIVLSRHNLSRWSPYKASVMGNTNQVCIFCHTPHNAEAGEAPLWNHQNTASTFTMASTVNVVHSGPGKRTWADGQPTGVSKKCLSCHDGTVSIGAIINTSVTGGYIAMSGSKIDIATGTLKTSAFGHFSTNLRSSHPHPISFTYTDAATAANNSAPGSYVNPLSTYNQRLMLDRRGKVQCHTCHDPHNDWGTATNRLDPFWRKKLDCNGNKGSVCGSCHSSARECADSCYDDPITGPMCDM